MVPTPSKAALKEELAKKLKADAALIDLRDVAHSFGGGKVTLTCYVYKDAKMAALLGKEGTEEKNSGKESKSSSGCCIRRKKWLTKK